MTRGGQARRPRVAPTAPPRATAATAAPPLHRRDGSRRGDTSHGDTRRSALSSWPPEGVGRWTCRRRYYRRSCRGERPASRALRSPGARIGDVSPDERYRAPPPRAGLRALIWRAGGEMSWARMSRWPAGGRRSEVDGRSSLVISRQANDGGYLRLRARGCGFAWNFCVRS